MALQANGVVNIPVDSAELRKELVDFISKRQADFDQLVRFAEFTEDELRIDGLNGKTDTFEELC